MKNLFLMATIFGALFITACGGPVYDTSEEPIELLNMAGFDKADKVEANITADGDYDSDWRYFFWCEEKDGCALKFTIIDWSFYKNPETFMNVTYELEVEIYQLGLPGSETFTRQLKVNKDKPYYGNSNFEILANIPYNEDYPTMITMRPSNPKNLLQYNLRVIGEWESLPDNKLGDHDSTWIPANGEENPVHLGTDPFKSLFLHHVTEQEANEDDLSYWVQFDGKDNWYGNETVELIPIIRSENHPDFGECTPQWRVCLFVEWEKEREGWAGSCQQLEVNNDINVIFEERKNLIYSDSGLYTLVIYPSQVCAYETDLTVHINGLN